MKENLKFSVLYNKKIAKIEPVLPKKDIEELAKMAGIKFPAKVGINSCQGYMFKFETNEKTKAEISFIDKYNNSYCCIARLNEKIFKYIGNKETVIIKITNQNTSLQFTFSNDYEDCMVEITIPEYFAPHNGKKLFEIIKSTNEAKEMCLKIQKNVTETNKSINVDDLKVTIRKERKERFLEKVKYKGNVIQEVRKNIFDDKEKKMYTFSKDKDGSYKIEIILTNYGLWYKIDTTLEKAYIYVVNRKETEKLIKILNEIPKEKFSTYEIVKSQKIVVEIEKQEMPAKLKSFIESEEQEAIEIFNQNKISL